MANTGIGMRGWLEAAEGWGLAEPLRSALGEAYVVARGPKARGAIRAAGLHDQWSPDSESCDEVLDAPAAGAAWPGSVIAVQLHGERAAGVHRRAARPPGPTVIEVPVYRWAPPTDPAPLHRLIDLIAGRLVDAVTFTSAPAVEALLRAAGDRTERGARRVPRRRAGRAASAPVTAEPLLRRGVPVSAPGRARLGALVRTHRRRAAPPDRHRCKVAGHLLTLRGHAAVVDGELRPLAPAPMAVLRALADAAGPGAVPDRTAAHAAPGRRRARGGDGGRPAAGRPARPPRRADRGQARLPPPGRLDRRGPRRRHRWRRRRHVDPTPDRLAPGGRLSRPGPGSRGRARPASRSMACSTTEISTCLVDSRFRASHDHHRHVRRDGQRVADVLRLVLRRAVEAVDRHQVRQPAVLEEVDRREGVGDPAGVDQHHGARSHPGPARPT